MKSLILKQAERFLRDRKNYKRWLAAFFCLAVLVTLGTVTVLKYTGTAMTGDPQCGYQEHVHTEDCYLDVLVCGQTEASAAHQHSDACYEEVKTLSCNHEEHKHGEGCFETVTSLVCSLPEHTHGEECLDEAGNLVCGQEEHTHKDSCFVTETILTCEKEEHTHSDSCYTTERKLICGQQESGGGHVHTAACYEKQLVCGLTEHTHERACYSNTGADVENAAVWEATLPAGHLSGTWAENLVAVAKSQLGYQESADNFILDEQGEQNGYTRYGAWYGNAYGTWSAMYVSFCLNYAGIPAEAVPQAAGCYAWTVQLGNMGIYRGAEEGLPQPGDLIFFDNTGSGTSDHMGIVEKVEVQYAGDGETLLSAVIRTVEGDVSHQVGENTYSNTDARILGYCDLQAAAKRFRELYPDQAAAMGLTLEEISEPETDGSLFFTEEPGDGNAKVSRTAETENYIVTATYDSTAKLPENAELKVIEYARDSEAFRQRSEELGYEPDWLLNIGFFLDDAEVEPNGEVNIKVIMKGQEDVSDYEVIHFADSGAELLTGVGNEEENGVSAEFVTGGFSDFAGTRAGGPQAAGNTDSSGSNGLLEVAPIGGLHHEKFVKDNEDGTYDLTLNVKSAVAGSSGEAKLDIIFVVDQSGSMAWDPYGHAKNSHNNWGNAVSGELSHGISRLDLVKQSIGNLLDTLEAPESGIDAKYKLVTFSDSASAKVSWWADGSTIKYYFPSSASGATNYQAALATAGNQMTGYRTDAKQIVIFLTDGVPTTYTGDRSNSGGNTSSSDILYSQYGAEKIQCDYFLAVGYGAEMTSTSTVDNTGLTAKQILDRVAAKVTAPEGTDVSATTDIAAYFTNFIGSLNRIRAVDVSFTDTLSAEVDLAAPEWTIRILDGSGNDVTDTEQANAGMTAVYTDAEKRVDVSFASGYELKQDYTYSVTARIQPNDSARELYAGNRYAYPHTGEKNTDAPGNTTSSDQPGIFCNAEGSAVVNYSYKVNDTVYSHEPLDYPRPVVQIPQSDLPAPDSGSGTFDHKKQIDYLGDGVSNPDTILSGDDFYRLYLDMSGKSDPLDLLIIVDRSNSMSGNGGSRAVNALLNGQKSDHSDSIITRFLDMNDQNNAAVMWFGGIAGSDMTLSYQNGALSTNAAGQSQGWTNSSSWGRGQTISNISYNSKYGTNYCAAYLYAEYMLEQVKGTGNQKVVIFISDGQPSFGVSSRTNANSVPADYAAKGYRISSDNWRLQGNGYNTGYDVITNNFFTAFYNRITAVHKMDMKFYQVGYQLAGNDLTAKIAATAGTAYQNAQGTDDLISLIKNIIYPAGVKISDVLSENVDYYGEIPDLKVTMTHIASGETATLYENGRITNSGKGILDRVEVNGKEISATFQEDYSLSPDYTYTLSFNVKVTEQAYDHTGGQSTGMEDTDYGSNTTSSGQPGLYSNQKATVSYTVGGKNKDPLEYDHPVVQLHPGTLTITKEFQGLTPDDALLNRLTFTLTSTNSRGETVTQTGKLTVSADGAYTTVFSGLVPGREYTLTESGGEVEGYDVTASLAGGETVTVTSDREGSAVVTNTYTPHRENLRLAKVDEKGNPIAEVAFTLTSGAEENVSGEAVSYSLKTGADGIAFFTGNGEDVTNLSLPCGSYTVTETAAPARYYRIAPFTLTVTSGGIELDRGPEDVAIRGPEGTNNLYTVTITNQPVLLDELQIRKVNSDGGREVLEGAKFSLYDVDPEAELAEGDTLERHTVFQELVTGQDGLIRSESLKDLPAGEYWLIEDMAPDGYSKLSTPIHFRIFYDSAEDAVKVTIDGTTGSAAGEADENGVTVWTLTVPNSDGKILPQAGGAGTVLYTFGGLAILAAGLVYGFGMRRMRERGPE